jgi:hypothetical protein
VPGYLPSDSSGAPDDEDRAICHFD